MAEAQNYPQIGVGAVVFHRDKVLLIKRGKPPRLGQWSLPGGRQELGETVEDAVRREVWEETGLRVRDLQFLEIIDLIDRDDEGAIRFHYTLLDYSMESDSDCVQPGSDAADAAWYSINQLDDLGLWSETLRIIHLAAERRA